MNVTTHCQKLTDERFVAMLFRVHVLGVPGAAGRRLLSLTTHFESGLYSIGA